MKSGVGNPEFPSTQWSLIAAASGESEPARCALADLCQQYWYPVYAFIRKRGSSAEDAADLTQSFFATLLEKGYLEDADPLRGRFRSFLLTAAMRFVSKERDKAQAQKRGGGARLLSLDFTSGEERFLREPAHQLTPERLFDRRWALTILDRTLSALQKEAEVAGKQAQFETLKVCLTGEEGAPPLRVLGERLGLTEGAVKVAIHRLRQKYRERLRTLLAETLASEEDVEDELRQLLSALKCD